MGLLGQTLLAVARQADGLLLLVPVALWGSLPLCLCPVVLGYLASALAGTHNQTFAFRSANGEGTLFALCLGPLLVRSFEDGLSVSIWSGSCISADVLALGSLQALLDMSLALGRSGNVAQVAALVVVGHLCLGRPLSSLAVFLALQKIVLQSCFDKGGWGRCFSPAEGLFWAQSTAILGVCFMSGSRTGFRGWSLLSIFQVSLLLLGAAFLGFTIVLRSLIRRDLAAVVAGLLALFVFLLWAGTGWGGWSLHSQEVPLVWFLHLLAHPQNLRLLLLQWPLILFGGVALIELLAKRFLGNDDPMLRTSHRVRQLLFRKAFHVVALALFVPPLWAGQGAFLGLSLLVAALLFLVLETCRVCRTPLLAQHLDTFVGRYVDAREDTSRGDLVLTHLYLLLGCALPIWLESGSPTAGEGQDRAGLPQCALLVLRFSGLLLVGVGDACAAAVGASVGRHCWPNSHRTLEGSAAYVAGVLLSGSLLLCVAEMHNGSGGSAGENRAFYTSFAFSVLLSALVEVYTQSIDNLVLPLFFCPVLRLLLQPTL